MSITMVGGHVDYDPTKGCIYFGDKDNTVLSENVLAVKELFDKCHIAYQINDDMIHVTSEEKEIYNSKYSCKSLR